MNMKKSIVSKLAVVCLTAVVAIGGVSAPASAKSKGYVFKYKGVSVTMNGAAKKLIKKAGKPSKKTVKKSCAYKGKDRTYTYKDFQLKTYSKTNNGAEYVSEIRFRSNKAVTKEGIRIGSSLKDVTKKYGKAKARFGVYTFKKGSSKLQIMLNGNKVSDNSLFCLEII